MTNKRVKTSIIINSELLSLIKHKAIDKNKKTSHFIEDILREYLDFKEKV